ncbi:MAG: hypothetical protein F6K40_28505 [Okeania sp. SIO3I5]|uniref:hypothetical protein n=1 Tax=Okeania sp. SIO3I5 TaxID=2607805 RepID=UPI0013BE4164|nr:hypothetical protein [Okeania sp. SIO3I5]NEQ39970.1 hypothetical protein [Okeania sp. SIO3I5]
MIVLPNKSDRVTFRFTIAEIPRKNHFLKHPDPEEKVSGRRNREAIAEIPRKNIS